MNKELENLLNYDAISEQENECGKHWSRFSVDDEISAMLRTMKNNNKKKEILKQSKDTYFGMSWDYFINLLKENGFKLAYENGFVYDYFKNNITNEKEVIYYHPTKGLVLYSNSYDNCTTINEGTLYCELQSYNTEEDKRNASGCMSTGGFIDFEKGIIENSYDIREGLFHKLNKFESYGTFLNRWTGKNKFLWFVNYKESKQKDYDRRKITNDKIEKCPQELKDILNRV